MDDIGMSNQAVAVTSRSREVAHEMFRRWVQRHPDEAADGRDPRSLVPCAGLRCRRLAWRGYEPYCGWCFEDEGERVEF